MVTNIFMTAVFAAIVYFVAHGKATASELLVFMWFSLFELFQLSIVHDVVALSEREEARKIAQKAKKEAKEEVEKETNVKIPEDLDTETSPFGEPETSGMALPLETSGESTGADEARLPLNEISSWTKLMIAIRWMAFNGFYLWFWFHGLTVPNILQCMEPRVFLFANLGAYGNARTFFKILFVVVTVMGLYYLTLMAILYIITGSLKSPSKRYLQETSADERGLVTWLKKRLEVFTHDENGKAENLHWPDLVLPILLWALSIVATELEIEWNNFQRLDILSALGQIIPFAIGASFFIRACLFRFGILESEKDAEEATEKKTGRLKKKVKGKLIKKAEAVKREE
jgi:hypothetical protein